MKIYKISELRLMEDPSEGFESDNEVLFADKEKELLEYLIKSIDVYRGRKMKQILRLRYLQEKSLYNISQELNLPIEEVKQELKSAIIAAEDRAKRDSGNLAESEDLKIRLENILATIDIPIQRKNDYNWLSRNISIRNSENPNLIEAIGLISKLRRLNR